MASSATERVRSMVRRTTGLELGEGRGSRSTEDVNFVKMSRVLNDLQPVLSKPAAKLSG